MRAKLRVKTWHLDVRIRGKVQGVSFRFFAREEARKLGISGFAENLPDGSVSIEAEGAEDNLKKFLAWCQKGPSTAEVEDLDFTFSDNLEKYEGFEMR